MTTPLAAAMGERDTGIRAGSAPQCIILLPALCVRAIQLPPLPDVRATTPFLGILSPCRSRHGDGSSAPGVPPQDMESLQERDRDRLEGK